MTKANSSTKQVRKQIRDLARREARQNKRAHGNAPRVTRSAVALACTTSYSAQDIQNHPVSVTVSKPPCEFLGKALKVLPRGKGGCHSQYRQMLGKDFWV